MSEWLSDIILNIVPLYSRNGIIEQAFQEGMDADAEPRLQPEPVQAVMRQEQPNRRQQRRINRNPQGIARHDHYPFLKLG